MTESQKVIDAVAQGTFEWLFEKLITKEMGNSLKSVFMAKGPEALKKAIASEGTLNLIGKAFKKYGVWFSPVAEGASEALTTIGQNAAAKYSGEDPDRKLWDGVPDSFIAGFGMGGMFGGVQKLGEMYANRQDEETEERQITEQQTKLSEVEQIAKTEEENIRNEATGMAKEGTQDFFRHP